MKVSRLKKGYRIHLSDTEYEVLANVFGEGAGSMVGQGGPEEGLVVETDYQYNLMEAMDAGFVSVPADDRRGGYVKPEKPFVPFKQTRFAMYVDDDFRRRGW